jgi:CopA family copper-resistance protein
MHAKPQTLQGNRFDLSIGYQEVNFTGRRRIATAVNGTIPSPVLRWREGDRVTLRVTNQLATDSSLHWHGVLVPTDMDGVPGFSFNGIKPGETFEYQFDVTQSGTYWYHSHTPFQEQTGMYGAIVIDPRRPEPFTYDRDYVVMLSDWSDEEPEKIYAKLKKQSHYYNFRQRTAGDLWRDLESLGLKQTLSQRDMWNRMRMSYRDISDVTGYTYTFLMNGRTPADGWTGQFKRGEQVRLRFINGAAMSFFDVRIPGLKMTVVAADGQNIEPVTVDEFRIGVAETYDVIVAPKNDTAYSIFAQAIDRTGYARGTLTPDPSLRAAVPEMDPAPVLTHADMGMAMDHGAIDHSMHDMDNAAVSKAGRVGHGSTEPILHRATEFGPQVDMRAEDPQYRPNDPGIGLRDNGRRVLTYADLRNLYPTPDPRDPDREIQLHLTGNMSRYMWSVDGIKFSDSEPLEFEHGERVRITLVNDTMMNHPMHLHGMWSDLESGDGAHLPRKHTVIVQPGSKISYLVTADARGTWAYHCHLLYHMPGMFRKVIVS